MREIVLHYHLFKNAGTSLDQILKRNFPTRWVTAEFPANGGNNTALVEDWIRSEPEAAVFSSHTMMGPIPKLDGVTVVPVILLRDPVKRIESAYKFERNQQSDNFGAKLAKEHDFAGYVRARLDRQGDRQCRNFHVSRLAALSPGSDPELDRAIQTARKIHQNGVLGLVERFDDLLNRLRKRVASTDPEFAWQEVRANTSAAENFEADTAFSTMLADANSEDYALLTAARDILKS